MAIFLPTDRGSDEMLSESRADEAAYLARKTLEGITRDEIRDLMRVEHTGRAWRI